MQSSNPANDTLPLTLTLPIPRHLITAIRNNNNTAAQIQHTLASLAVPLIINEIKSLPIPLVPEPKAKPTRPDGYFIRCQLDTGVEFDFEVWPSLTVGELRGRLEVELGVETGFVELMHGGEVLDGEGDGRTCRQAWVFSRTVLGVGRKGGGSGS